MTDVLYSVNNGISIHGWRDGDDDHDHHAIDHLDSAPLDANMDLSVAYLTNHMKTSACLLQLLEI